MAIIEHDEQNQLITPDSGIMTTFFGRLPAGLTTLCYIPAKGGAPTGATFSLPDEVNDAVTWAKKWNAMGYGIYWTVNPSRTRLRKKPKKTDIVHGRLLHRDIDPSKDASIPYEKRHAAILHKIEMFKETNPVPTIIIDSGHGFYPIYLLDAPADEVPTEAANKHIGRDDGDGTWNIDRLLRLPGSINWPQPKKVKHYAYPNIPVMCRLVRCGDEKYAVTDFLPIISEHKSNDDEPDGDIICDDPVSFNTLPNELKQLVKDGVPEGDRSEAFHKAVCWLGDLGYSADAIVTLLQAYPAGIAAKYIDRLPDEVKRCYAKRKEQAHNSLTRKQLADMIDKTNDFDRLTKEVLLLVYQAKLSETEQLSLLKFIAKKSRVSVKSLKADAKNFNLVGASKDSLHLFAAREVVQMFGADNLIHTASNVWRWDGCGVWRQIEDREIQQKIHDVADGTELTASIVNSILDLIKTELHKSNHRFDVDVARINCISGEIEYLDFIPAWLLGAHVREHFRTTMIPVAYDENATAPRFKQFLGEVFDGDHDATDKIAIIEEALGYTLIASCHLEKFLMLIGSGANGKSVLLAVLAALLGREHICAVQPSQFDNKFQRGHLFGKLANIITEIAQGAEIADDKLKSLVSGELTTAEHKFKDPFDFVPIATHWFGTNHLPHTRDFSDALFRRGILLTFNNKFEGDKQDVHLIDKLKAELPGILNIALRGLTRLIVNGAFTECTSSEEIKHQWRLDADQARQFVEEKCTKGNNLRCNSADVYVAYKNWAEHAGIRMTLNRNNFTSRLKLIGYDNKKGTNGTRQILGLKIKEGEIEHDDCSSYEF